MKISQKSAYVITGIMVLFAILPSSWYVSLYYKLKPHRPSTASSFVSEHKSWYEMIYLGSLQYKQYQYEEAESKFREALELANQLYPKIHHRRAKTLHILGMVLLEQGKSSEAVTVFDEEVDIRIATLPEGDDSILNSLRTLAEALYQAGDKIRAASTAQQLIAIADAHDKSVSDLVIDALMTLSKCDLEHDHIQAAGKRYQKVLDIEKQLHGEVSVPVILARFYIAGIALTQKNNQEVDKQLEACKSIIKILPTPLNPEEVELLGAFIEALPSIGLADKAVEIRQLLDSLDPNLFVQRVQP